MKPLLRNEFFSFLNWSFPVGKILLQNDIMVIQDQRKETEYFSILLYTHIFCIMEKSLGILSKRSLRGTLSCMS
jgi:hypothetical protein